MTDQFNPPSIDPAQRDTIMGTVQFIIDKLVMQEIDKMMPAKVIAVVGNRVSVQIMVSMVSTAKQNVVRAVVANVPIYQPSAGGYVIHFPVQPGDLGWIKSTDTDISLFLQNLKQSPPNTNLTHRFDSAVFYPDNMGKGVTIAGGDAAKLTIQKYDGSVKITLGSDVEITPALGVGVTPRTGTIIDGQNTSKAVGVPAMTSTQKAAVSSPQLGYLVFDTTLDRLSVYTSMGWA